MSDDVKLIITGTFALAALAWVATHADKLGTLSQAFAGSYGTAVAALYPKA